MMIQNIDFKIFSVLFATMIVSYPLYVLMRVYFRIRHPCWFMLAGVITGWFASYISLLYHSDPFTWDYFLSPALAGAIVMFLWNRIEFMASQ